MILLELVEIYINVAGILFDIGDNNNFAFNIFKFFSLFITLRL